MLAALQSGQTAGPREEGSAEATDYQAGDSNPGLPAPASDQSAGAAAVPSTVSRQAAPTFEAYCELEGAIRGTVLLNEPMSRHTSFRIGGPAALFIECSNLNDLQTALSVIERYGLDWTTLGKGSNLLVSDQGFGGAVLTLGREFKAYRFPQDEQHNSATEAPAALVAKSLESSGGGALLVSGAGVLLGDLVRGAFKNGYSGLEFAVGIPGTVGGALFMNAGSAEVWISAITASILVLRPGHGLLRYAAADLNWGYRSSGLPSGEVILESTLVIQPGNASHIRARMEAATRRRQKTQPLNLPSAGSVFRNPDGGNAGQLIDALGLKGLTIGGASISTVHANFIVNQGQAKAVDVVALIQEVRRRVKESYGFELHTEIRFLGFH
ncbi:MAG: UDP-N-acetylmuramate dehydrogenase [Actinomycetia bacterium]|nr:UDP-N-acetylmuramate dehydrogenase [Actinomycetes bacterium]